MSELSSFNVLVYDEDTEFLLKIKDQFNQTDKRFVMSITSSFEEVVLLSIRAVSDCIIVGPNVPQERMIETINPIRKSLEIPIIQIVENMSNEDAFQSGKTGITSLYPSGDSYSNLISMIVNLLEKSKATVPDIDSEILLEEYIDNAYLSVYIFDSDLNFVFFNKNGATWMNLDSSDIGRNMLDIYPELISTGRYDEYMKVLKTGEPQVNYIVEYSGEQRRHLIRRAFKFGEYLGVLVIDISRQIESKGQLEKGEAEFRDLVEMLPEIVFELDQDGIVTYLNPAANSVLGYSIDDLAKDNYLSKIFTNADRKSGVKKIKGVLEGVERPTRFQFNLQHIEGTKIPSEFYVRTHESASKISGLRGIIIDLSEKHETERELRESQSQLNDALLQLNAISEGSPDLIIFLDNDLRIKYVNKKSPLVDVSYNIDVPFYKLFSEDQETEIRENLESILKNEKKDTFEFVFEHNDSLIYYETIAQPLQSDGTITGVILSTRDMTERVENERERAHLERNLISERLRYEKLEEVNQLKTNFMATATHEIRTPLTAIAGYSEIIEEMLLDEDYEQIQDMFDVVRRNVERMLHLINELLDVQRIDRDKMELNLTNTTLQKILKTLDDEMSPRLYENFQKLVINNSVGELNLNIDETRIHQVFTNLIINASKFSELRQVIVLEVVSDGEFVSFSVSDDGIGLTKEDAAKLFEPFPDIEPTVPGKGTGLGLFISRNIVEAHGGTINVNSDGIGKGTKFTFTLPMSP